jgi:hypothetical protein
MKSAPDPGLKNVHLIEFPENRWTERGDHGIGNALTLKFQIEVSVFGIQDSDFRKPTFT